MTSVDTRELEGFLAHYAPFDSLDAKLLRSVAAAATVVTVPRGEQVLDAFTDPTNAVFVILSGRVDIWNDADRIREAADESLGAGELFGFSAMLTERSVGPRAVAATLVTLARVPAAAVAPVFASRQGARFLAETLLSTRRQALAPPAYSSVEQLITSPPLLVEPTTPVSEVARLMTERDSRYAVVPGPDHTFGLVTDSILRRRMLVEAMSPSTPAGEIMQPATATAVVGESAQEAQITLLDHGSDFLVVTDRAGELQGVIAPRDFAVSPSTAGVALNEQLRRASTPEELDALARQAPTMLADVLGRGLPSGRVIAVYSSIVDAIVRRAIQLTFQRHPELSTEAFTWLALGSNGRREAVLSSDVDSAVAFVDGVPPDEITRYRAVFAEVDEMLIGAGLMSDDHGASARRTLFARTNADWRTQAKRWLAAPTDGNGAMMTSLLVDGRPVHGDTGLTEVAKVFSDLRRHPGTMRLLLQESLSSRARLHSMRQVLSRRNDTFDVKTYALVPVVNIGRWAALSVGSAALPTTERLRVAAGSAMLPRSQASTLIEVFETLQRLRLRYQLLQIREGIRPSDVLVLDRLSAIDRTVIAQAVREVSSIQRRMANVSNYVPTADWSSSDGL
ncbi:MAG: putative nucleotidyltransferase substrate binding domain-containing protein [Terracoccus sp.]